MDSTGCILKPTKKKYVFALLIGTIFANNVCYASSGQYFSDFTWQNPAELAIALLPITDPDTNTVTQYHQQLSVAETNLWSHFKFEGVSGPIGAQGSGTVINNTYEPLVSLGYINRINQQWVLGLNVGHPFDIFTSLPENAFTRYSTTYNLQTTLEVSPSISYQPTNWVAFGAGPDIEKANTEVDAIVPPPVNTPLINKVDDWGYGWHIGGLLHPFKGTFIGLWYYSKVDLTLKGSSAIPGFPTPVTSSFVSATLPPTARLKVFQGLSQRFGLIGRIDYTKWDTFQNLVLSNTPIGNIDYPYHYHNTWRYGIGARYALPATVFNAGVTYDEAPGNSPDIRVSQPLGNAIILGVGIEQNIRQNIKAAIAYSHAFVDNVPINNTQNNIVNTAGTCQNVYGNQLEFKLTLLA